MSKQAFIDARLERWRRLELLLDKLEHTAPRGLVAHELDEFVYLYRIACSDLARARAEELGDDVEGYINVLIARGHVQFHPPSPPRAAAAWEFVAAGFPRAVQAIKWYVLAATLLFVLPIAATAYLVAENPARAFLLAPPAQLETLTDAYATGHQGGRSEDDDSAMAGYYINNNIGIAFRCFATGAFFGLGSAFFLVLNGVIGGAIGAYICKAGYSVSFLSFIVGHGAFELTAIVLSGAAGLRLGMLLVNPGRYRRLDALKVHGPLVIRIVLGVALMLLVAAMIEGFWSPCGAAPMVKFVVGAGLWMLVIAYLSLAGRFGRIGRTGAGPMPGNRP